MKPLVLFLLIAGSYSLDAQIQFQKAIGGTLNDRAEGIVVTTDSGYAVFGQSMNPSTNNLDFVLLRLDKFGDTVWTRTFGTSNQDEAEFLSAYPGGGFILTGYTFNPSNGTWDVLVAKTRSNGDLHWMKSFGGSGSEFAFCGKPTLNGDIVVVGYAQGLPYGGYDAYYMRLDSLGEITSFVPYGDGGTNGLDHVVECENGDFLISGWTQAGGAHDALLQRVNRVGALLWSKIYPAPGNDDFQAVAVSKAGDVYAAGIAGDLGSGGGDILIVKTTQQGNVVWSKTFGGSSMDRAEASIAEAGDGDMLFTGITQSLGVGSTGNFFLLKLSPLGTVRWIKTYGGPSLEDAKSCVATPDGGFAIAGWTSSFGKGGEDMYVVKTDSTGSSGCNELTANDLGIVQSINSLNYQLPVFGFSPSQGPGTPDSMHLYVDPLCFSVTSAPGIEAGNGPSSATLEQNYPNPFNPSTLIEFTLPASDLVDIAVYDGLGQKIETLLHAQLSPGTHSVRWNPTGLSSGTYYYQITTTRGIQAKKMILVR